jgi:hypothetical protein
VVTSKNLRALFIQIPVTTADASPYHPKSVRHSDFRSRKTECVAKLIPTLAVRAAPFALSGNIAHNAAGRDLF